MSRNPHQVTKDFEAALCEYTGAPFAVTTSSCSMALLLAVKWHIENWPRQNWNYNYDADDMGNFLRYVIAMPKRTYVSVPMAVLHAGARPTFANKPWLGYYRLEPVPVFDSARLFTGDMYSAGMICVSFHASKTLGLEQGGAILHDNPEADKWLRMARFDGRQEGVAPANQHEWILGYHCYMNPSTAAQGILKLHSLPRHNDPLPNDDYPDLSQMEIFR